MTGPFACGLRVARSNPAAFKLLFIEPSNRACETIPACYASYPTNSGPNKQQNSPGVRLAANRLFAAQALGFRVRKFATCKSIRIEGRLSLRMMKIQNTTAANGLRIPGASAQHYLILGSNWPFFQAPHCPFSVTTPNQHEHNCGPLDQIET
jgi:hypothetical protein